MRARILRVLRHRGLRTTASVVSLGVVASVLTVLAVQSDGSPVTDVSLNDGSVWVTNRAEGVARLNPAVKELDQLVAADSSDFDVLQSAGTIAMTTAGETSSLRMIDVATATAGDGVDLPGGAGTALGGSTVAVVDRTKGDAWFRPVTGVAGLSAESTPADLELGEGGLVTVGTDGTAYALDVNKRRVSTVAVPEATPPVVLAEQSVDAPTDTGLVRLAAAGSTPVVLDQETGSLSWPTHGPADLGDLGDPAAAVLQQSGDGDGSAYVATSAGIRGVDLETGAVSAAADVTVDGTPAAPVVVGDCVYAAWADPTSEQAFTRICGGSVDRAEAIPLVTTGAQLVFRVNRDVVVLNDVVTGDSWLVQNAGLERVANWESLDPQRTQEEQDTSSTDEFVRTEKNHPPQANDDSLGARPGLDTILPVTLNDTDQDGDILRVSNPTWVSGPQPTALAVVGKGTELQASFAPDAAEQGGSTRLRYSVDDGRDGTSEAYADVRLSALPANEPPALVPDREHPPVQLTSGATTTVYVAPDWLDPDGDDVLLTSATAQGGDVQFRADGVITYTDDGQSPGPKTIDITMSDGLEQTTGTVALVVSGTAESQPELVADAAQGIAGSPILVAPLANDRSPDGKPLSLVNAKGSPGYDVQVDAVAGTFTVTGAAAGTAYVDYTAATDSGTATSFVRVDVLPASGGNNPPVAVRDHALLVPGGSTLIDVLANDSDADNDVLVVQKAEPAAGSGVKALLIDHRMLRITTSQDLSAPQTIEYAVSDGEQVARGSVVVTAGPAGVENLPPVAVDDAVTIRAGAVGRVPVLANDSDPDGDALTLYQSDLSGQSADFPLFVAGRSLRLRAPAEPGQYRAVYGVRDAADHLTTARISITVLPDTPADNRPPRPQPVLARTFDDRLIRVDVPLANSDPDGDAVSFTGIVDAPALGRIARTGLDWFDYEPVGTAGTDSFQLTVADKYGGQGTVDVRIGVVPRNGVNQPPVALDDELRVRPGRTVAFNVLGNDIDPDSDRLALEKGLTGSSAEIARGAIQVRVPAGERSTSTVGYTVTDPLGGTDSASLVVIGDPDAPLFAPVARDDAADLTEISGKAKGGVVDVDVRENDSDLDGGRDDLVVSAVDPGSEVLPDGRLRITLDTVDRVVVYRVTDADAQQSFGFVFVAGTDTVPPVINPDSIPVEVKGGELTSLPLRQFVLTRPDHEPILTSPDTITAIGSDGTPLYTDRDTLQFRPPQDAWGPASLTFEVTDGLTINDASGLRSLLTIPIDVIPVVPVAPIVRNVEVVVPLDGPARPVDLRALVEDPNPGQLETLAFDVSTDESNGGDLLEASESGGVVSLAAASGARNGDTARATFTATDSDGEESTGTIGVRFVGTDRPVVGVRPIRLDGEIDQPSRVDVADYLTNVSPDFAVSIISANVVAGPAGAPSVSGTSISVTPTAAGEGPVVVRFRATDEPEDQSRQFIGQITVDVAGLPPEAPGRPGAVSNKSGTVDVTWKAPEDNGSPITGYTVFYNGGQQDCARATACTVSGLANAKAYRFAVRATNKIGDSERSPESAPVTPDTVPSQMAAPTAQATQADGQVALAWSKPTGDFSAVQGYDIGLQGSGGGQSVGDVTTQVWNGLTNGDEVRFRIRARNEKGVGEWSPFSAPVHAYGKPLAPGGLQAASPADGGLGKQVSISWNPADPNGEPLTGYTVSVKTNGSAVAPRQLPPGQTSATFDAENGKDYTFTVTATNPAGEGPASADSNTVNPYGTSGAVTNPTKVADRDRAGQVRFGAPEDTGGRPVAYYVVASNGGPSQQVPGGSGGAEPIIAFNANAGPYTVTITPYTDPGNGKPPLPGKPATVGDFRPYGKPGSPIVEVDPYYRGMSFAPSSPAPNGRPVKGVQVQGNAGGWSTSGTVLTSTDEGGQEVCLNFRTAAQGATSADTEYGDPVKVCGRSDPRVVTVTFENIGSTYGNCQQTPCYWINVAVEGFRNGQVATLKLTQNGSGGFVDKVLTFDGNGRASYNRNAYTGFRGNVVATIDGVSGTGNP